MTTTNGMLLAAGDLTSVIVFIGIVVISMIANAVKKRAESRKTTVDEEEREFDLGDLLGDWTAPREKPPPPPARPVKPIAPRGPTRPPVMKVSPPPPGQTTNRSSNKPRQPKPVPVGRGGVRPVVEVLESALPVVSIATRETALAGHESKKAVAAARSGPTSSPLVQTAKRRFDFTRSGLRHAMKLMVVLGPPKAFSDERSHFG